MKHIKDLHYFKLFIIALIATILFLFVSITIYKPCRDKVRVEDMEEMSYVKLMESLSDEKVDTVYYSDTSETVYVCMKDGVYYKVSNPEYEGFKKELLEKNAIVKSTMEFKSAEQIETQRSSYIMMLSFVFIWFVIYYFYKAFSNSVDSSGKMIVIKSKKKVLSGGDVSDDSRTNGKVSSNKDVSIKTFEDVAGLTELKKDMACIVDFLVNKEKYQDAGAKLPKGIILYGPPGTGKTLLAKAVAGEADVPFLYMSGSEFIEMYVGLGAKRVRELFAKARKQAPCIIFIDEIDAIGGIRDNRSSSGEDRKTINALLTEMDGFKETENIIVIAATNRLEDLDPALTRPGRFTNKYCVPLPETVAERMEIINLYIKNKKLDESLDIKALAKETVGFSPAKIEALLNEASIISVQDNSPFITKEIVDKAMYKLLLQGHMKDGDTERDLEELQVVAWHEAGHAVIGHLFGKDITKVTIIPSTSGAGGVTFSTPTKTRLLSSTDIRHEIMELYGGRLAELLFYKEDKSKITTGASNDIERATSLIHDYVTKYGMSDTFGLLNLETAKMDNEEIVSCEVKLAKEIEKETLQVLKSNLGNLKEIANLLLENSTVYSKDIDAVFAA